MGKYKKCPRCELNYIEEDKDFCDVCIAEMQGSKLMFADMDDDKEDAEKTEDVYKRQVRLFTPSARTESMPNSAPTAIFAPASNVLQTMPSMPEKIPARTRFAFASVREDRAFSICKTFLFCAAGQKTAPAARFRSDHTDYTICLSLIHISRRALL